jgi:glycosyltransferase involved in cell wall biosynthesis
MPKQPVAPKVSVILTSYNHAQYLREAIDSVLNQTFADFELIIWDDASSDNSWHLIKNYSDRRIKAFRNKEQKRGIWGINQAITKVAQGDYIAIHHSDDIWEASKLEKQIQFLDHHPKFGAVFTNALAIGEDGDPLVDSAHFYANIFSQPNRTRYQWLNHFFYRGNALCHPSVLIRKQCYDECGLYRYGFAQIGDLDMWIRLCLRYEIEVLPEKLVRFRVRDNEANTSGNRIDVRARGEYEFLLTFENYRRVTSVRELSRIFPGIPGKIKSGCGNVRYLLAKMALTGEGFRALKLFGLNLLFELLNDEACRKELEADCKFKAVDFIRFTEEHDVFGLRAIASEREGAQQQIEKLTQWATEAEAYAKSMAGERAELRAAVEAEREARARERAGAQQQIEKLTQWATEADAYAKSMAGERAQLQAAVETEREARASERAGAQQQIEALEIELTKYKQYWIFKLFKNLVPTPGKER